MAKVPVGGPAGSTRAEQIAYYATIVAKLPGTYQGNYTQYDGMTWGDLYETLANASTSIDPGKLAAAIEVLEGAQSLGKSTATGEKELGKFVQIAQQAVPEGVSQLPGIGFLSGIDAIGQFFNDLRDPTFWIRAGKIIAGSLILIIGLLKLTGATDKTGSIAQKAVKAAPFL